MHHGLANWWLLLSWPEKGEAREMLRAAPFLADIRAPLRDCCVFYRIPPLSVDKLRVVSRAAVDLIAKAFPDMIKHRLDVRHGECIAFALHCHALAAVFDNSAFVRHRDTIFHRVFGA